jgi:hypothetical protein
LPIIAFYEKFINSLMYSKSKEYTEKETRIRGQSKQENEMFEKAVYRLFPRES